MISNHLKVLQNHHATKIDSVETKLSEFNIRESIKEVINFFVSSAQEKSNVFKTKFGEKLPEKVYTDQNRVLHIL